MMKTELNVVPEPAEEKHAYWERYAAPIDLDNTNDSRVVVLSCLPALPQRVLELGCSAGFMTKVMAEQGHQVTAIEIDPVAASFARPFADRVLVGDLDHVDSDGVHLLSELELGAYDTLIAADVLEHLRDPLGCLRRARELVKADGRVILSIPNVAHGDVRLALLAGRFDYRDDGLLDRTHTQLFTLEALVTMIRSAGLAPVDWKRTQRPIGESEIEINENLLEFGRQILADDPEVETYQWIVSCQDATVAGSNAIWPELQAGESVVAHAVDMMNAPVAEPDRKGDVLTAEKAGNSVVARLGRRLRRILWMCRDRLVVRLDR